MTAWQQQHHEMVSLSTQQLCVHFMYVCMYVLHREKDECQVTVACIGLAYVTNISL